MLRGLATVTFFTDDMDATTTWYAELLGAEPYFEVAGPDGKAAYREFRIGDYQHELGFIDRRFEPGGPSDTPAGAVAFWHVDDIDAALERLFARGAKEYDPRTVRTAGFITASVVDPWGNVLGLTHSPHYLEVLKGRSE